MKTKTIAFLALTILSMEAIATTNKKTEKKKYKEIKLTRESDVIDVPADQLWEIVGRGFEKAGEWSTAVDHSVGSGDAEFEGATCSNRMCALNARGFDKISETLTKYDEESQELIYTVDEGMPGSVTLASNHWTVMDLGNGKSALKMNITMHTKKFMGSLMGGMMKKNINNTMTTVFDDLKVYAETGSISKEKAARMAKLTNKKKQA